MKVLIVTNMYPNPKQPAFGTFVKDQAKDLRQAGVEVDVLFFNGRQSKLNYLKGALRLWQQLLKKDYDIIHAHYALSGMVARLQWKHPVVVTYHGVEVLAEHSAPWLTWLSRKVAPLFDRVIVVAQAEKDILEGAGVDPSKVVVIPCAVDISEFESIPLPEARARLELPVDKPLVLWAGEHWRRQKRFELVEESMALLKKDCPDAELVLVSGQPHEVIPVYMSACDVLLLTSRFEGSPMVIKEAMACNLPIVSTRVGDVPEVISGVEGCYLVEPDAREIADRLLQVIQWGKRTDGREHVQYLKSDLITQRVIDVYNELCPPERRFTDPVVL
jgi:teichuronic acid biosynthesis glycosyltransferase TuaC